MSGAEHIARSLLRPKSVALIGQSDDADKTSGRPLAYLRRAGWQGAIYPVNPTRDTVLGERAYKSIADLPETPDLAFVLSPTERVLPALQDCAARGVGAVSVLAGGFAESGEGGAAKEQALRDVLKGSPTRLLGPNSLGMVNLRERLVITANAAFAEPDLPVGRVFAASHSGSMIGALMSRGKAKGLGFAGLVSVGAEADLSLGEICEATLGEEGVDAYVLFLESLRHAKALRRFAEGAAKLGRPVIAYKLGRSEQAQELAQSHTGALAGEDDVADALFRDCGIVRVHTLDALLEAPVIIARTPIRPKGARAPKVGVVTTTGGGAALVVDQLGLRGIEVAKPSEQTFANLKAAGVEAEEGRIIDLTLAGTRYPIMKAAIDTMLAAPEFDLVLAVAGSSARFQPDLAVKPAIDAEAVKPFAMFVAPEAPEALLRLAQAGVPAFRTPESAADAIAAALTRPASKTQTDAPAPKGEGRYLDEMEAYDWLSKLGFPSAPAAALSVSSVASSSPVAYPVAVKILSADVLHKTDIGGVVLGVKSDAELKEAIEGIVANASKAGVTAERVLVQSMTSGLGEALVGFKRDPDAGPIVLVAAGGVMAEIYKDRAVRLAPVTPEEAEEMIRDVKSFAALSGYRGKQAGDLKALARAISALSQLALTSDVIEAEINPLLVKQDGVVAVDAVMRVEA
ncbi:MAG: acetate--CoA ligase family protein [Caulobacterales bacterium]